MEKKENLEEKYVWGGRNGIEPSSPGWSPGALPTLCYSRLLDSKGCCNKVIARYFFCQYNGRVIFSKAANSALVE
jgi:hypothetical protein